ncbi:MAG: hypothetical protein ACFFG0_42420 [Candidatus Thorarchaeota archaeon]
MHEFKVNRYLSLKLENSETNIYVNDEFFIICKFLLLNVLSTDLISLDDFQTIDELELDNPFEENDRIRDILPIETEFRGHCSNLQIWAESGYNTNLLHRSLAFPLLKKLTEAGDLEAKRVFKEEIARRFSMGFRPVQLYLIEENYLSFLTADELDSLLDTARLNNDLYKKVSFFKEKPLLFIHYTGGLRDFVKFALSYIIQEVNSQNFVFGYLFTGNSDRFFVFSSEGSFQNLLITDDYNIWEKGYDLRKEAVWDKTYDIEKSTLISKKELFEYLKNSLNLLLRGDGEYYVLKENSLKKFKKLDSTNDYIFMSDNFNKDILFFLSNYWILPFHYKGII